MIEDLKSERYKALTYREKEGNISKTFLFLRESWSKQNKTMSTTCMYVCVCMCHHAFLKPYKSIDLLDL